MQLIELGRGGGALAKSSLGTHSAITLRVLVVDIDLSTYQALRERLDSRYIVHHSYEVEEAEALLSTLLYSLVIVRASVAGSDRREQLEFVRFVSLQSERTRVIVLDEPGPWIDDDGSLQLVVDLVLAKAPQPSTLALLVSELTGAA